MRVCPTPPWGARMRGTSRRLTRWGTQSVLRDGENGIAPPDSSYQTSATGSRDAAGMRSSDDGLPTVHAGEGKSGGWSGARGKSWNCLVEPAWEAQRDLLGKSHLPRPPGQGLWRKLEILVRHLEPTIVCTGRPGVQGGGRARLVCLPTVRGARRNPLLYPWTCLSVLGCGGASAKRNRLPEPI
jgi:hypothetical protein